MWPGLDFMFPVFYMLQSIDLTQYVQDSNTLRLAQSPQAWASCCQPPTSRGLRTPYLPFEILDTNLLSSLLVVVKPFSFLQVDTRESGWRL